MPKNITHLHVHSHYSLLNALPKLPELVARAKEHGMDSLALTDNGALYGAIEFYKECAKTGIKPIIGVDFYTAIRTRRDKDAGIDNLRHRLVLLAENKTGYVNLIKLVTDSFLEGFYYKPRIDRELMEKYSEGLICIVPFFNSELTDYLDRDDEDRAKAALSFYKKVYGKDSVFLEVAHHQGAENFETKRQSTIALGAHSNTPLVGTHEVFYMDPDDKPARDTLLSVQSGPGGFSRSFADEDIDFSFAAPEQMREWFADIPEALENTRRIADRCTVKIELENWRFPDFKIPEGTTYDSEFRRIVEEGLQKRGVERTLELLERMEYELAVIQDKGYSPYFLAVADLLKYAHENGILTTIRGSVAGSLVTYLAGITNINPLEYNIPFERFLNPDRPSAPDIDMDYADDRRDEVIAYTREKYGANNVAQIGTFGTMMARGAVRDVTRALGYDYAMGDQIAKLIPFGKQGFPVYIKGALEEVPELKELYNKNADVKKIVDMAEKIEGCARHIGVHAAGVVISPQLLNEDVPVQPDPKGTGKLITQYDMHSVGEDGIGLLKFDFLGIKNLAILADAIKRVEKIYGDEIDIEQIPLDDAKTYGMLARGETTGVFQLNGEAMTKFLKELQPSTIHDINVMVALYRPGPMKNIPEYIARKHGKSPIRYHHPKMEAFLNTSYGILVYQEDIMLTALALAGYTWKNVDALRKAIGKKIPKKMAEQHEIFVNGCIEHSRMTQKEAEELWDLFEPFQGYGFNKAHAASYGRVAYQTAYMKANYPTTYMSAVLTADSGDTEKVAEIIAECKRMDIPVLPPDINESFSDFTVVTKEDSHDNVEKIRFGLTTIKNFGQGISDAIIAERKQNGKFASLVNFLDRIQDRNLNKKSLESLIKCGAMDSLGERGELLHNLDDLLAYNRSVREAPDNQDSLFGLMEDRSSVPKLTLKKAPEANFDERLAWEKELLGLYVSGHPLEKYRDLLKKKGVTIEETKREMPNGATVILYGLVEDTKEILTKKGDKMAFVKLLDDTGTMECVAFPKIYKEHIALFAADTPIGIKGKTSNRNGELSVIIDKVKLLENSTQ